MTQRRATSVHRRAAARRERCQRHRARSPRRNGNREPRSRFDRKVSCRLTRRCPLSRGNASRRKKRRRSGESFETRGKRRGQDEHLYPALMLRSMPVADARPRLPRPPAGTRPTCPGLDGRPAPDAAVIEFLHRAQWERKAWEDRLAAGRAVYGQAGDRHYDTGARKSGANGTTWTPRWRRAPRHPTGFVLHGESTGDIYDHRIAFGVETDGRSPRRTGCRGG